MNILCGDIVILNKITFVPAIEESVTSKKIKGYIGVIRRAEVVAVTRFMFVIFNNILTLQKLAQCWVTIHGRFHV